MSFETIRIANIINSILVEENIRPAMLIQSQDYGEAFGNEPKTQKILSEIR